MGIPGGRNSDESAIHQTLASSATIRTGPDGKAEGGATTYHIENIQLFVRETKPGRVAFKIGSAAVAERRTNPLVHVRMVVSDSTGKRTWGTAGDRLSVRWLDKRPGRSRGLKLRELIKLIASARRTLLEQSNFETAFGCWRSFHPRIMAEGRRSGQEELTASFASALMERAVIDAVSRLHDKSTYRMVSENLLGIDPHTVHPELQSEDIAGYVTPAPRTRFYIRHTVGPADALTDADVSPADRIGDGLPETLAENIDRYGLRFFKVKISGRIPADLDRLVQVWDVLPKTPETTVTLDANEAYRDLKSFEQFVAELRARAPGLFDHIAYIEQPLLRALTLDESTSDAVRKISASKLLLIDEADGRVDAYRRAHAIGYAGTSHKNCKGFFKSLLNRALVEHYRASGRQAFMSGEDLQNLPIVPLHQDFVAVSLLGLADCERNGHHLNYGLSMLSSPDKASIAKRHQDLYEQRGDEWFLRIRAGMVETASLHCPGFGVADEPDFGSMEPLQEWIQRRFP